jgi:hypothetical protein
MVYFARALGCFAFAAILVPLNLPSIRWPRFATGCAPRVRTYWAEQVEIQRLGATAWLHLAAVTARLGAFLRAREAARHEDATDKNAVTPGPLAPARELLGDMLMQLSRPTRRARRVSRDARKRNRIDTHTVDGARRAAAAAGRSCGRVAVCSGTSASRWPRRMTQLTR